MPTQSKNMRRASLRCPVPREIQEVLERDPWMKTCLLADETCEGRLNWQHSFTYAGRRISELYFLLPLCESHHRRQASFRREQEDAIRERITHFKAESDFREKYSRSKLLTP